MSDFGRIMSDCPIICQTLAKLCQTMKNAPFVRTASAECAQRGMMPKRRQESFSVTFIQNQRWELTSYPTN